MDIGNQLSRLGVDICEAGFPIASQGDFDAVSEVAKTAGQATEGRHGGVPMRIAGLSRANKKVRPNPNPTNPNPNPSPSPNPNPNQGEQEAETQRQCDTLGRAIHSIADTLNLTSPLITAVA